MKRSKPKPNIEIQTFQTLLGVFYGFGLTVKLIFRSFFKSKGNGGTLDNALLAKTFLVKK